MRRRAALIALVLLLPVTACGGGSDDDASGPSATAPPVSSDTPTTGPQSSGPRAAARWETVTTFTGSGPFRSPEFQIMPSAIQWRIRYTCGRGTMRITSDPPPRRPGAVVDAACPKEDVGYSIITGGVRIAIEATGDWKAVIDQQVDTPLDEPLLAGMTQERVIASGPFYKVEVRGEGMAKLYRLADGRRFVRFEGFQTGENTDLFVWLSDAAKPTTSQQAISSSYVSIGNLKSTLGTQNYEVPGSLPTEKIRSIIIWCEPVAIAYAAAALS